jgi:hypothetical protein
VLNFEKLVKNFFLCQVPQRFSEPILALFFNRKCENAFLSAIFPLGNNSHNFGTMFALVVSSVPSHSFSPAAVGYLG